MGDRKDGIELCDVERHLSGDISPGVSNRVTMQQVQPRHVHCVACNTNTHLSLLYITHREIRKNRDGEVPVSPGGRGICTLTGWRKCMLGVWERQRRGLALA